MSNVDYLCGGQDFDIFTAAIGRRGVDNWFGSGIHLAKPNVLGRRSRKNDCRKGRDDQFGTHDADDPKTGGDATEDDFGDLESDLRKGVVEAWWRLVLELMMFEKGRSNGILYIISPQLESRLLMHNSAPSQASTKPTKVNVAQKTRNCTSS